MYYFAIFECDNVLSSYTAGNKKIEMEFEFINSDGSQYSTEDRGLESWYFILFIFSGLFFAWNLMKFIKAYSSEDEFDWAHFIVLSSLAFMTFSYLFYYIHFAVYENNGKGIFVLQLFA